MATKKDKWEWFGLPGHFICSQWCRFHLCTLVGKYLISTVGEYVHPRHGEGSERGEMMWLKKNPLGEDISVGGFKYETMVFLAGTRCDVPDCGCGMPIISGNELYSDRYKNRKDAGIGHLKMCERFAKRK